MFVGFLGSYRVCCDSFCVHFSGFSVLHIFVPLCSIEFLLVPFVSFTIGLVAVIDLLVSEFFVVD